MANPEDYREENVRENLLFGTPDEVIEKLRLYQDSGVDLFCYGVSFDLGRKATVRSLELFIERVMPAFAGASWLPTAVAQHTSTPVIARHVPA